MGIEYYLIKDDVREIYDLGRFTGDWAPLLAVPGTDPHAVEAGGRFSVDPNLDQVTLRLEEDWLDIDRPAGYLRLVAQDVIRWAGSSLVRFSSDGSHDGWRNRDGTWDEGQRTGSRYRGDHPEWPVLTVSEGDER